MKTLGLITLAALLAIPSLMNGQGETNVIGYYAVGNSLDGQPMIDMTNILRFYPVFAIRDSVRWVDVTVYHGPYIYERYAEKMDDGAYWQVLLPKFRLGEAIQRIEVECHFHIRSPHLNQYRRLTKEYQVAVATSLNGVLVHLEKAVSKLDSITRGFSTVDLKNLIKSIKPKDLQVQVTPDSVFEPIARLISSRVDSLTAECKDSANRLGDALDTLKARASRLNAETFKPLIRGFAPDSTGRTADAIAHLVDSLLEPTLELLTAQDLRLDTSDVSARSKAFKVEMSMSLESAKSGLETAATNTVIEKTRGLSEAAERLGSIRNQLLDVSRLFDPGKRFLFRIDSIIAAATKLQDSIRTGVLRDIMNELSDTTYSGVSVRKSDIVINDSLDEASILYRNYKTALRRMPALDPAERVGIFRIRYVPFPIVGTITRKDSTHEVSEFGLRRPFSSQATAVFEIGLGFGDVIVPGDEFVVPEFSVERLGVALAITDKLFSDDAEIIALALTYDFNSYASIGIGANFAPRVAKPYASFGINKKAFESMLSILQGLFK